MNCSECDYCKVKLPVDTKNGRICYAGDLQLRCVKGYWVKNEGKEEKVYHQASLSAINQLLMRKKFTDRNCII